MTLTLTIGPISITDQAHLFDNNSFKAASSGGKTVANGATIFTPGQFSYEEGFEFICENYKALQLKGLVEIGEPVWIDTSSDLTDNDYFQHKGWYLLNEVNYDFLSPTLVKCKVGCTLISTHQSEYLTMDYTRGIYDGAKLDWTYAPTTNSYDMQDDMSTLNATNWDTTVRKGYESGVTAPTATIASDGAELDFQIQSGSDGRHGCAWIRSNNKYVPPFTLETVLDRNSLPGAGSYDASIALGLAKEVLQEGTYGIYKNGAIEWFYAQWSIGSAATSFELATSSCGYWRQMYPWTSQGTANAHLGLKLDVALDGTMTAYTDLNLTGTWTQIWKGYCNVQNLFEGLYVYLHVYNKDTTAWTGSFHKMDIYRSTATSPDYIVHMPYSSTLQTAATGHRHGEDGDIYYYKNPTSELRFQNTNANLYKGSVKLLSSNNSVATDREVYHTDAKLTPTTTTLKNAFTKLTWDADEMILSGWDSGAWQEINRFDYGSGNAITIMKPLKISHDEVWLQVNDTKIHMTRNSPMISLYHPNTAVTYTIKDRFYYGGALDSSISPGDSIAMTALTNGYYSYTYNNASATYRTVFGKRDPTTIKADSLPADNITGIGWNTSTMEGAAGIDTAQKLVEQWWKQTRSGISWKQIV